MADCDLQKVDCHLQKLSAALWRLRGARTFCDTRIIARDAAELSAHAAVLGTCSDSLLLELQKNRIRISDTYYSYQLDVPDYDISVVEAALLFIYTGDVTALRAASSEAEVIALCSKLGLTIDMDISSSHPCLPGGKAVTENHYQQCTGQTTATEQSDKTELPLLPGKDPNTSVEFTSELEDSAPMPDEKDNTKQDLLPVPLLTAPAAWQRNIARSCGKRAVLPREQKVVQSGWTSQTKQAAQPKCTLECVKCKKSFPSTDSLLSRDSEKLSVFCVNCETINADPTDWKSRYKKLPVVVAEADGRLDSGGADSRHDVVESLDSLAELQILKTSPLTDSDCKNAESAKISHRCTLCKRRFTTLEALERHESGHLEGTTSGPGPVSCKSCGKSFHCVLYLRDHERTHRDSTRHFVCEVCGRSFLGSSNLAVHRRSHTDDRPYPCSFCEKRFTQLCSVREHEKIHIGVKSFVCDVCGKQFLTGAQLFNHSRTHGGVKSHECGVCQKWFYTNGDLVKHARIHADVKPFVCVVCGKGFKYSSNLHGHARIHTGDRPYPCPTCNKTFTYSSHLHRHIKMHSRQNFFLRETPQDMTQQPPDVVWEVPENLPVMAAGNPLATPGISITPAVTLSATLLVQPHALHLSGGQQSTTNLLSVFALGSINAHV